MADEEKKKAPAEDSSSGGFLDVMGRMGEGLIDGLAQSNPIVGLPLQAGFNTAGYQDKQLRRQAAKEALITSQQRNEEWRKEAPLREKQRINEETKADEFARGADDREAERRRRRMELAEYANAAPVRETQNSASLAKSNLAAEQADTFYMQGRCAALRDGLKKDLSQNPAFGTMSFAEQDDFCNSPRVQTMIEAKYYIQELQSIGQRDQGAFGRMDRALRRQGWSLVDGENGVKYLDMGERGRVPATKEAIDALNKQITSAALEELNTRSMLADASTMENPAKRSVASRTKALMPYNGNDATASLRMVQGIFDSASEQDKGWHLFHQAISDYQSSGLPTAVKMDGLSACMPFLQKMGYAIEVLDPKNPNIDAVTVIDLKNKARLTFSEFSKRCEDNDALGKRLDERIVISRNDFDRKQKRETLAMMRSAKGGDWFGNGSANAKGSGGNAKGDDGNKDRDVPDLNAEQYARRSSQYGEKFKDLDPRKAKTVITAEKAVAQYALASGALERTRNGIEVAEMSHELLNEMVDYEERIFKNAGLSSIADKGYWHLQSEIRSAEKDSKRAEEGKQRAAALSRTATQLSTPPEGGFWERALWGFGAQQAGNMHLAAAVADKLSDAKKNDAEERREKAKRRLIFGGKK